MYCNYRILASKPTWSEVERWPLGKVFRFADFEQKFIKETTGKKEHTQGVDEK